MKSKKIGVLLPVYAKDNPEYFSLALQSILNQSYENSSIYIGIDGPIPDKLTEVIKSFQDDKRVILCWFKENRGLAMVLNDLIKTASSDGCDYYARMDADDISLPDRFTKQIEFLENNPDIDVVGGAIQEIDEQSRETGKQVFYPRTNIECRRFFRFRDPLAHPAVMFRKSFFEKAKGYRSEYRKNQDTMLWYDGFMNGCCFSNLNDIVLKFRVTSDFYNRRNGWKRARQMLRDRLKINRDLGFDLSANLFAYAMFLMTISPNVVKRILYKIR